MNDDCLFEIFSRLPIADLVRISDTCKHFKGIATKVFSSDNALPPVSIDNMNIKTEDLSKIIETFKRVPNDLHIADCNFNTIMDLLTKCSTDNVRSLHLNQITIEGEAFFQLRPLFANLTSLCLNGCTIKLSASNGLLSECKQLVKLEVVNMEDCAKYVLRSQIPQLKYLILNQINLNDNDLQYVGDFFQYHKLLKHIEIKTDGVGPMLSSAILNRMSEACSGTLELLYLHNFDFGNISKQVLRPLFGCLKSFKLNVPSFDNSPLYFDWNELVKLDITFTGLSAILSHYFPKLQNLTVRKHPTHIFDDIEIASLTDFLMRNDKLKEIELHDFESKHLPLLSRQLNTLENLEKLNMFHLANYDDLIYVSHLEHIRKLKLFSKGDQRSFGQDAVLNLFMHKMTAMRSLQHLQLKNVKLVNSTIRDISKCQNLRKLELVAVNASGASFEPLVHLSQLSELRLEGTFSRNDSHLTNLVTESKKLRSLTLGIDDFVLDYTIYDKLSAIVNKSDRMLNIYRNRPYWTPYRYPVLQNDYDVEIEFERDSANIK